MKKLIIVLALIIIYQPLSAQNVGIGNTNPLTSLDVTGAIRTRPDSVFISQDYQVVDISNTSFIRLDGSSGGGGNQGGGGFTINLLPGKDGQHLRLEANGSYGNNQFAKLVSGTYLNNGKRILLASGSDFIFMLKGRFIDLFYSDITGWTETGRNLYSATDSRQKVFSNSGVFAVPVGITSITVAVWGAGGYSGTNDGIGGNGGFVAGTMVVNQGEYLNVTVAGTTSISSNADYSSLKRGTAFLLLAAGGGNGSENGGHGGNAGSAGQSGTLGSGAQGAPGGGATISAGGAGGLAAGGGASNGTNGGSLSGGNCITTFSNSQGDGGIGYFGGGGSSNYLNISLKASGGGGGGSNYASGPGVTATHNTQVGQIIPVNILYDNGGLGGTGGGNGQAGKVVISW